eukprot:gnl/MRDRNA2_/MRDRNA2_19955_c0_seq1.p1 gnl/MRDRNA2_/MRDRNA2_19955_c0~~gnl/MRDRNA2_/MRDRNA2_19955_c0_seq1.p1  ORF type:complete len:205 (+),score=45.89 gnl/MRDRNA2_/MRDRNA2_19955_c0_seq1:252-866(+)
MLYNTGIRCLAPLRRPTRDKATQEAASQATLPLLLNLAQARILQGAYREAADAASEALQIDCQNLKALYRRGAALAAAGDFVSAQKDLRSAVKLAPRDREIRQKLHEVTTSLQKGPNLNLQGWVDSAPSLIAEDPEKETERNLRERIDKGSRAMQAMNDADRIRNDPYLMELFKKGVEDAPGEAMTDRYVTMPGNDGPARAEGL